MNLLLSPQPSQGTRADRHKHTITFRCPLWGPYLHFLCWLGPSPPQKDATVADRPGWTRRSRAEAPRWSSFRSGKAWVHHFHNWFLARWSCWPRRHQSSFVLSEAAHLIKNTTSAFMSILNNPGNGSCHLQWAQPAPLSLEWAHMEIRWVPVASLPHKRGNWGTRKWSHLGKVTAGIPAGGWIHAERPWVDPLPPRHSSQKWQTMGLHANFVLRHRFSKHTTITKELVACLGWSEVQGQQ